MNARLKAGQAAPKTPKDERHTIGKPTFHRAPGRPHAIIQSETIAKPAQLQPSPSQGVTPRARKDAAADQLDLDVERTSAARTSCREREGRTRW